MYVEFQQQLTTDTERRILDLLAMAQKRETELETLYLEGHATKAQLAELEQVRVEIEDALELMDGMGYLNPS
jgi:hypothetical protein